MTWSVTWFIQYAWCIAQSWVGYAWVHCKYFFQSSKHDWKNTWFITTRSYYYFTKLLREKCPNTEFFSGPYFPAFGLNTERYGVFLLIQSKCGKIRTRKTLNTDTFHAMEGFNFSYPLALVYTANRNHRYSCFDTHAKVCLNIFFINST